MLEGKKRRSKSGDNFTEMAADTARKSAISVIEVSSSISISDSMTEATTVVQKSSSDGTIIGKRSISFGTPRNRLAKARTPSSGARSGKGSSQVSVLTVSISDSEDVDPRGPPPSRRGRNPLAPRSRPESPPWTSARSPQHVTRSCSRHLAMQRAAQMRGYSRSPSPKPGYTVASARMYSASPTRVRSPMRVPSPRRTVFQVVDESYYAEPANRDRARLLRREDQRFQMTADDPKPQRDGKWHEPKLRVSYAARVPSRGSHSDSSLSYSMSSKTALDYERGDSSRGYYRTASQLDRYREPSGEKSYSSTPQLYYEDSPPRIYHDHSPMGGYVEGSRHASGAPIHGRDVSLSRISEYSSPNAGHQDSTGKMIVNVSSSRLVRSASLPRTSSFNPRMPRRGTPSRLARESSALRDARSSSSPRQSRSMSPRKPDTALARIKVRAASSLHLGYETSSSRSESSRRVTGRVSPNWLERKGFFPNGPLSPPPPKPPVPPPMPPPKGFSMGPLGFESTSTSASAIRITMSPPPMPPVPPMLPPPTPTEIAALQAVTVTMKDLGRKQSSSEHELCAAELQRQIREKQQLQLEQLFQLQQPQDFSPLQDVEEQQLQQQLQELQKVLQQQEGAPVLQVQFQSPADPSGKPSTPLAQSVLQVQFQSPSQPVPQVFQAQIPTRADSPPGVIQVQLQSPIVPSEPQQIESFSQVTSRVAHPEQPGVLQVQLGSPLDFQAQPVSTQQSTQADQISVLQAQLQSAMDFSALTGPSQVDQLSVHQSPLEPKSTASDQGGLFQMQLQGLMDFSQQPLAQLQQPDKLGAMQAQLQSQLGFPMQATAQAQQPEPPGVIQMQFHSPSTASTGFIGQQAAQASPLDQSFLQSPMPQMDFTGQLLPQVHMAGSSMPQMGPPYQTMSQIQLSMHQGGQLEEPILPQQGGFASPQICHGQQQNQSFLQMQMQSPMMPSVDFASQPFQQPPFPCEQMSHEQELAQNMLLEQQNRQFSLQMHLGTSSLSNFMQGSVHQMPSQQPTMQDMQDWAREQIPGEPMCHMQEWGSALHMPGQALQMSEGMVSPDMRDVRLQAMGQNQLFNQIPPQELSFSHVMPQGLPQSPSMEIMNEMMQKDQLASRSSPQVQLGERRMEEMRFRDPLQQQLFRQRSQPHTVVMFQRSDRDVRLPRQQGTPQPRSSEPRMQRTPWRDLEDTKRPPSWWFPPRMSPRTPSRAELYPGMVFESPPQRFPVPFMMRMPSPILPRRPRMPVTSPYPGFFRHNLPRDVTPGTPSQLRTPKPQEEKPHTPQPQPQPQQVPTPQKSPQSPKQHLPKLSQSSPSPQAPQPPKPLQPAQTPQRQQSSQEQQQPKQVTQKLQQTAQNSEPCMQQIPLPVTGYEPSMHEPPFPRFPFRMPRPRSAALLRTPSPISPRPSSPSQPFSPRSPPPGFHDLRQLELQTRLQQQMLEQQQQQMRDQMMAVARLQCPPRPTRSPTSPIPMMPRSSPNLLPPYGAQMFLQQQMQMQKMQQANQMNRLRGMGSDTDGAGYLRRKMLSATKSSLPDVVSPSDYGNTTLGTKSLGATSNLIDKRKPLPPHIHAHPHAHRKQNYRHSAIETRMRNSQTEMVVYFVVLLATIIGLWTVLDIYGRRTAVHSLNGSYIAIPNASLKGLRDSSGQNGVSVNVSGQPGFELCSSSACLAEGSYVSHQLNWNVNPCESMYEFVCSNSPTKPADELLLSDMETSLLRKLRGASPAETPATKLMHDLWKECLDQDTRNRLGWGPLKHMFKAASLPDWPYQQYTTQGEPAVWQAAARALRYFGLATLVLLEPSEHPLLGRSPLLALDKPVLLLHPGNDSSWYYDAVSLALSSVARKNVAKHSIALDMTNFARQLASVVRSPGASVDMGRDAKLERLRSVPRYRALLAGFLQNESLVNDDTELLLRAPEYAIRLGYLLDDTAPHVVLNYIGFRLLVHVSPFVPESLRKLVPLRARQLGLGDHGPGQLVCLRAVEHAMPTVFYRAAYELHRPLMDALLAADLGGALKQALASRLALLHWLDGDTRERALQRLHQLEPRLLFPTSVTDTAKAEQDVRQTPHVIVGEGLRSYARITKHLMHRRLQSADPWLGHPPSDDQCWLGPGHRILYLPLTALNASAPAQEPFVLLQLARLGERAARCLVRLVLDGAGSRAEDPRAWWTPTARQGLAELRKCYALQSRGDRPTAAEESAALVVAHAAFEAHMPSLDFRLENAVSMSLDQLFFIHYTLGYCTADSDVARRVNLALLNFGGFQRAFTCDAGTPMNPRKSCDFW